MRTLPRLRIVSGNSVRAFSLIELLVVISIVAVLVAMLIPALARARYQATIVSCGARLHQNFIAISVYENDWRDTPVQSAFGGTAREYSAAFVDMVNRNMNGAWAKTVWCPSQTFNSYGIGYHYYANYTLNPGLFLPGQGPYQRRSMEDLTATAVRAKRVSGSANYEGRWLLMADRMQVVGLTGNQYDFPPQSVPNTNGATAHILDGVTGANLMWVDGSVEWRSIPDTYRMAPMAVNTNTGPKGWAHIAVPYTNAVIPVEAIDITISWPTPVSWFLQPNYGGATNTIAGY